ncbi:MAG TPA: hypothetical protein VF183_02655 [Acidimicrobiales bacterium]
MITEEFIQIAQQVARLKGHPDLRMLVLPYPLEGRPDEEVARIAEDAYPRLLAALGVVAGE